MPLAVVVLDKRKPARSQLETAPNKFGPEPGQLETPARQAQVEGSYVLIFHPHIWSWDGMSAAAKRWLISPLSGLTQRHFTVPSPQLRSFHGHRWHPWVNFSPLTALLGFTREGWSGVIFGKL